MFDYTWVYGPIRYKAEIKVNGNNQTVTSESNSNSFDVTASPGDTITACAYYGYEKLNVSSTQRCVNVEVEDKKYSLDFTKYSNGEGVRDYLISLGALESNITIISETSDTNEITVEDDAGNPYNTGKEIYQSTLIKTRFVIKVKSAKQVPTLKAEYGNDDKTTLIITSNIDVNWKVNGNYTTVSSDDKTLVINIESGANFNVYGTSVFINNISVVTATSK